MKRYLLTTALLLVCHAFFAQVENKSTIVDWRQHNLTKYNKFLVNPTYSIVRNDTKAVSFWSRIQWTGVENSPQTYLLSYSGKVGENSGAGLGLYQQSLGLLVDSGLIMNYAYNVRFSEEVAMAVGVNATLFRRGLDKNTINTIDPDPAVLDNQDDFLLLFMPGINFSVSDFDFGVYAENFFDYNFNDSNTLTDFSDKIFSGQIGYTKQLEYANGMFTDATWRTLAYGKTLPNEDFQYGVNSMIDLPYTGWFQVGYNSTFGISGGLGVKIGDGISIGITYENGSAQTNKAFGSTYEAIATIELGPRKMRKNQVDTGGKATVSKNVDEENFVSSDEIRRGRDEEAENTLNKNTLSEEKSAENALETEAADQTAKYAVYGAGATVAKENNGATEGEGDAQKSVQDEEVKVGNKDQTDKYAQYGGEAVVESDASKAVQIDESEKGGITSETISAVESTSSPSEKVEEAYVESAGAELEKDLGESQSDTVAATTNSTDEINQELNNQQAEDIETAYQEFLRKSDSIAGTLPSKNRDTTAITTEVFGVDTSYKTISNAPGIEKGFYLVVNVFSQESYFNEFVDDLRERGFDPKFFINPENNYYYVYLHKANRYITIKSLQRNNVNNTYFADKWVLWVK